MGYLIIVGVGFPRPVQDMETCQLFRIPKQFRILTLGEETSPLQQ